MFLLHHDDDAVNRWQAGQSLMLEKMLKAISTNTDIELEHDLIEAWAALLKDPDIDPALSALILTLPTQGYLTDQVARTGIRVDPDKVQRIYTRTRTRLAQKLVRPLKDCYTRCREQGSYELTPHAIGQRRLKNVVLEYLALLDDPEAQEWIWGQFTCATNMTDVSAALAVLAHEDSERRTRALEDFYTRWRDDSLVVDKWLALQARADRDDCLEQVKNLMEQEYFSLKNPNRVRALIGTFTQANPAHFHSIDGSGYVFLRQVIEELDKLNPQISANLVTPLLRWSIYDQRRSALMRAELEHLGENPDISTDLYEMVTRGLNQNENNG
jgi:aminopeptidase N